MKTIPMYSTQTFAAAARTDGFLESDHTYAWTFSDGSTSIGKNVTSALHMYTLTRILSHSYLALGVSDESSLP